MEMEKKIKRKEKQSMVQSGVRICTRELKKNHQEALTLRWSLEEMVCHCGRLWMNTFFAIYGFPPTTEVL